MTAKAGAAVVGAAFVKEPKLAEGVFLPAAAARELRVLGQVRHRSRGRLDSDHRSLRRHAASGQREPPEDFRVRAGGGGRRVGRCARRIISTLARRAYRRPVTANDERALLAVYDQGHAHGGFETGIEWALERVLVSPDFLFRVERDPPGATPGVPFRITDVELASRLSFFLWSSIPDEELLDAAVAGRLQTPQLWRSRCAACSPIRGRALSWTTSPGSGSICATCADMRPIRTSFPTSTTTCARPSAGDRAVLSRASFARTAASSTCCAPITRSSTNGSRATTAFPVCTAATSGG